MESSKKRVLAYIQAKTLEQDDLASVSGGNGSMLTQHQTLRATSNGLDAVIDMTIDGDL